MNSEAYVDYRAPPAAVLSSGNRNHGEDARDYSRNDLQAQAGDMHANPLGRLVGDWQQTAGQGPYGYEQGDQRNNAEEEQGYYAQPTRAANNAPQELGYNPNDRHFLNDHTVPIYQTQTFLRRCILEGFQIGSFMTTLMSFNILVVVAIAAHIMKKSNPFHKEPPRAITEKDWEQRISGERFSSRAEYYANFFGYECEDIDVETEDGFVLRMHHLTSKKHKSLGHPVILQHGILSNSVTFCVNEERSLAFYLLEHGYDVYMSNIRTNFKMPHRHFPRSDPRYWSWAVKEIGIYDLPAIVDYVVKRTGLKPAYIGHSQGTGSMFLALSRGMRPDLGNKISSFIALGPAVYAGPVFRTFPFSLMRKFRARSLWTLVFGVREFIPIISILQATLPSWLFGHAAFPIFGFIFGFHDHNWLNRQIPKYFRTVGCATSSELLYYYMANLSYTNCIFDTSITNEPWFPASFPPLAVYYGTMDYLVLGKPLVERMRNHEPNVRLLKAVALENYEHLDMVWGVNAQSHCFVDVVDMIEQTKNGYPAVGSRR